MATQHPDNAGAPFWERDSDGFVSAQEEIAEAMACYGKLSVDEFMWDWEGKHADEAVIDKFFTRYHDYFRRNILGIKNRLTFRIPNIWEEKGYSLLRAFMVMLTSEDFARDLGFTHRPLFEVILPMTKRASQLIHLHTSFRALARFKSRMFNGNHTRNSDMISVIPLLEGVDDQLGIARLLHTYVSLYRRRFHTTPAYLRPFLARSDPAMISGMVATVLANAIALSDLHVFSRETGIPTYPIIGVGSLPFRGGLSPETISEFLEQYGGVRTVTVQSAFRYDYPLRSVQMAVRALQKKLPHTTARQVNARDRGILLSLIRRFEKVYQTTLPLLLSDLAPFFAAVPARRERRLHVGLLAYPRKLGSHTLPRAIAFTAGFYTIGVPPELIGVGRVLAGLTQEECRVLERYYPTLRAHLLRAGRFVHKENIAALVRRNSAWQSILDDIALCEQWLGETIGPRTSHEAHHARLSKKAFVVRHSPKKLSLLIQKTGVLRWSLG